MTKEYEIGISLLNKIHGELQLLSTVEDKRLAKEVVQVAMEPIIASAYQIKVGEGPQKEKLLSILFPLIRNLRELQNLEEIRSLASELLRVLNGLGQEATLEQQSGS
ncbi:hypothetical protein [Thermocrinis sp.]